MGMCCEEKERREEGCVEGRRRLSERRVGSMCPSEKRGSNNEKKERKSERRAREKIL